MAFGLAAAVVLAIVFAPGSLKLFKTLPLPNEPARVAAVREQHAMVPLDEAASRPEIAMKRDSVGPTVSYSGPSVALNDQQLSELNAKLIAARTDAAEKKTRVDFVADVLAGKKTLDSLPDSLQSASSVLGALRAKLADASQRSADLMARYNSRHPAVVTVEAEKRDIERGIAAETQRMAQTVRNEYTLAKSRLDALEHALREATGQGDLTSSALEPTPWASSSEIAPTSRNAKEAGLEAVQVPPPRR
jgi:hypothetical protein